MVDLVKHLDIPVIVVARSGLGTINHTLLTLEALRTRHVPIAGVVMVGEPHASNRAALNISAASPSSRKFQSRAGNPGSRRELSKTPSSSTTF